MWGWGAFRPVKEEEITDHEMHSEYCMVPGETARIINETRKNGGRVICVGTTSCRTVESFAAEDGTMEESAGWTNIFIYPGYRFKVLDGLITNFHLPESTLIMLVSALAGREHVLGRLPGGGAGAIPVFLLRRRDADRGLQRAGKGKGLTESCGLFPADQRPRPGGEQDTVKEFFCVSDPEDGG